MTSLREIYEKYRGTLSDQAAAALLQNAMFRRLIPALGGPTPPTDHNRKPISEDSIEEGLRFLKTVPAEKLNSAIALLTQALEKEGIAEAQQTRLRRCLRDFRNWAHSKNYIPVPNPIPQADLVLRDFSRYQLEPSTPLSIWKSYLKENNLDPGSRFILQRALIKYLLPATGGKAIGRREQLKNEDVERGMELLESMSLEVFDKALEIIDRSIKTLELSFAERMRLRKAISGLLDWARDKNYLPPLLDKSRNLTPWKSYLAKEESYSVRKAFEAYSEHLEECDRIDASRRLKSAMLRFFIPALDGPKVQGKRANLEDLERGLRFLDKVLPAQLWDIYHEKIPLEGTRSELITNRYLLRQMLDWACSQGYLGHPEPEFQEEVDLDFYKPVCTESQQTSVGPSRRSFCPKHTLGTFDMTKDSIKLALDINYVSGGLQKQLIEYKEWRLGNGKASHGIKIELDQILQFLGWLYRYKNISLEDLKFEHGIWSYNLILPFEDDTDFDEYHKASKKALLLAQRGADKNEILIKEYLDFRGGHPRSKARYLFLATTLAKFVYRDILGTDDFPLKETIPIIWRLIKLQKAIENESKNAPPTDSYDERSVDYEKVVRLVHYRKKHADKTINHSKTNSDYILRTPRQEIALANELQKFLSIALPGLVFPSRSRTYYELEIGRTFKEGLMIDRKFYSLSELKGNPVWNGTIKYYLHHQEDDSKTGKHQPAHIKQYGWWAEIPDIGFPDGSSLYMYIRNWLQWGRNVGGKPNHNFFFFSISATSYKKPLDSVGWRCRIAQLFKQRYGVKVPPQILRKIFVTHLEEQKAPSEVKEARACALQHSEEIAEQEYNMQHTINKMKPLFDFNQAFISKVLKEAEQSRGKNRNG